MSDTAAAAGAGTMTFDLPRRLAAEALGTGLLVAAVVGSGIMAERLTDDVALALLGNTLATGAALVVLINMFGPISGAQFNPAVTLAGLLRGQIGTMAALAYIVVQILGGAMGTFVAHAMFEEPLVALSTQVRTGTGQWLAEGVATAGLLLTIAAGMRFARASVPWLVGLYITAAYWFTASTSFANPAVTLARTLTDSFSGIRPVDAPAFIAAQLVGALLATALAGWLFQPVEEIGT
jgi:glycerol uptake facilitator-like aquaporin